MIVAEGLRAPNLEDSATMVFVNHRIFGINRILPDGPSKRTRVFDGERRGSPSPCGMYS